MQTAEMQAGSKAKVGMMRLQRDGRAFAWCLGRLGWRGWQVEMLRFRLQVATGQAG